ncbi:hypothetical protein [uncultured Aquimarina sp.]|uniref:hypothetical protein n=1 Tax=uncultured Aquimarina sp. TaxID=575652 RepID=UPI00261D0BCA|nr:hypothetical protein [uncultured Aquimarina sp.]
MKQLKKVKGVKILDRQLMIKIFGKSGPIEARPSNSLSVDLSLSSKITYLNESDQDFIPGDLG